MIQNKNCIISVLCLRPISVKSTVICRKTVKVNNLSFTCAAIAGFQSKQFLRPAAETYVSSRVATATTTHQTPRIHGAR